MVNRALMLATVVAFLGCSTTDPIEYSGEGERRFEFQWTAPPQPSYTPTQYANVQNLLEDDKPMLALFREDMTHDAVVSFFVEVTGDPDVALPILYHADRADISLSLVFSLAWVESRFSALAVNENSTSTDRGLFQLNSRTFRDLTEEDFFHPDVNTSHGIDYLAWCIEHTDDEVMALAAYNAGLSRAVRGTIPQSTRIYVSRIVSYRDRLTDEFFRYIQYSYPSQRT